MILKLIFFVGEVISKTRASGFISFQTLANNKTTRPEASWFQMFSRVWKTDETHDFVFEIVLNGTEFPLALGN